MRQKTGPDKAPAEDAIMIIRRATRRHFSAEDKIRIVLEGLRGDRQHLRAVLPRRHRLVDVLWLVEGVPGGRQRRLAGDTCSGCDVGRRKDLRCQTQALEEVAVADLTLENRLPKA